ncbi:hypothetical protein Pyn_22372 [Prunus yedoensis var. nudiflora]|uniref:Uncharacterized protein n=1 Tax=Prunus yedoensis var. nudiflora TaxID=2094558 RepID=A0A314XSR6_PRUYE|nr:hypothetical protein Pyn_22372 [Prunus yedoensis var. nudiflora]
MASSIEAGGSWTNVRKGQNLGDKIIQGKTKKRKTFTHGSSSEKCPQSVPVVRPPKENTPSRSNSVEPSLPMIELSFTRLCRNMRTGSISIV